MNTFYTHIQPNIVKFSDDEQIPEKLRCHYAINYNVWGIDYFYENYILQESEDGAYLLLNENTFNFILEDAVSEQEIIDIPRIYIMITDEFINGSDLFHQFVIEANKNFNVYGNGIPGFRPGKQYYLNTTLFNYLANNNYIELTDPDTTDNDENENYEDYNILNNRLPNYLDQNANITKYFIDLSDDPIKDYTNLDYFNNKNGLLDNNFDEETLKNFYSNLCNLIISYSNIKNHPDIYNKQKNQIYDLVLNYFSHLQNDAALMSLNLIMNSQYNNINIQNSNINCGCSEGSNQSISQPCSQLYKQAMYIYLTDMFSDIEFYEDWFCIYLSEDEKIPNDLMIETIQLFIKEFISLDFNLDFNSSAIYNCDCRNQVSLNNSSYEYKKINNFLQILDWINNYQLEENSNKIKLYGSSFGELLPKLQF